MNLALSSKTASIALTVWGLGLFPLGGRFEQFSGTLSLDTSAPGTCHVSLDIVVASLRMDDPTLTGRALGPLLLDAVRYPTLHYAGSCRADTVSGALTLHGVTRPVTMSVRRNGAAVVADGTLVRDAFGVDGYPGLVGRQVDMHVSVALPRRL